MVKRKVNFDYDREIDSLYMYVSRPSDSSDRQASISAGEYFTLDFIVKNDNTIRFKGLEILDASKWMGTTMFIDSHKKVTPKQVLNNIDKIYVESRSSYNCLLLNIFILSRVNKILVEAKDTLPVAIQNPIK